MDRNDWTEYTDADGNDKYVSFDGEARCTKETDRAILVVFDDGSEDWIPRSQICEESEVFEKGTSGKLVVTRWIAEQRGWA